MEGGGQAQGSWWCLPHVSSSAGVCATYYYDTLVDLVCPRHGTTGGPDAWLNITLGVSVRVFLEDIDISVVD